MANAAGNAGSQDGIPTLGIGVLGYAFMGKAHRNAFKTLDYIYTPPPAHLLALTSSRRGVPLWERTQCACKRAGHLPPMSASLLTASSATSLASSSMNPNAE
jgi:hypothetical protein